MPQRRIAISVRIRGRRLTSPSITGLSATHIPARTRIATTAIIPASNVGTTLTITTIIPLTGTAGASMATTIHVSIRPIAIKQQVF